MNELPSSIIFYPFKIFLKVDNGIKIPSKRNIEY